MTHTKENRKFQAIGHIVMIVLSANAIIPMVLLIMSSITDNDTLISNGYSFFPDKFSLYAYQYIFKTGSAVIHSYGISIILTVTGTIFSIAVTTLLAYALSKGLPGRNILSFYVFFTMLFNGGLVPTYINYTQVFGIKNTFCALLIPNLITNGFYILLMKSYFVSSIPGEVLEAAVIDGASEFQLFFKIALPLARPIVATIALFSGIAYWNDWMNGYIYLTIRNADVGLSAIPSVSIRMAMAVVGVLPVVIVYPFIQNNFIKGITLGGVKG